MTALDRTIAPAQNQIAELHYTLPEKQTLPNGMDLFCINAGEQDLARIDLIFSAGEWYQSKNIQASACIQMLNEGTASMSSAQIAEKLDFYGSFAFFNTQKHSSTVTLYSLNKYLKESLSIVKDMLSNPSFPEKEFNILISQKHQQFKVDAEKVEAIAAKQFMKAMFGSEHPYGKQTVESDFSNLSTNDLKAFHSQYISNQNCQAILSGKISKETVEIVTQNIGNSPWGNNTKKERPEYSVCPLAVRQVYQERANAVQTALRIGLPTINKKHPDYKGLQVLNTILGGYFGSRLMSNIREDKGYTYGIHSSLASLHDNGYFVISTQVKKEIKDDAIREIYSEVNRLCTELIPDEELTVVKNYMLGQILRYFDGPFNLADTLKSLLDYDLDYSYYAQAVKDIQSLTSIELKQLAIKYFHNKDFIEIAVG